MDEEDGPEQRWKSDEGTGTIMRIMKKQSYFCFSHGVKFVCLFIYFIDKLDDALESGYIKNIEDALKPKTLRNCKSNALIKAMEVCSKTFMIVLANPSYHQI